MSFVLDQHTDGFYGASSMKKQGVGRHDTTLEHISILSQPIFALSH
jgi:hypothetical protein